MNNSSATEFSNCPPLDFTLPSVRELFSASLKSLENEIEEHPLVARPLVRGQELRTTQLNPIQDPSTVSIQIGLVEWADGETVSQALDDLSRHRHQWSSRPQRERSDIIRTLGQLLQDNRIELAARIVREVGKPWKEADADVAEAIDFCFYYALQAEILCQTRRTQAVLGEDNVYFYQPRGIACVIAPWNFPLAIACGMTVAALVTGNATVLKPAEQSSLIAFRLAQLILEAGVPEEIFAFLPGDGAVVGRALVEHPNTDLICFTGSKAVGLEIMRTASILRPGQRSLKRVIAELGGKNAIIVDEDADLDEALKGVLYSAFGFAGQKCSACSRVIAVGDAYEPFLARIKDAAADLIMGPSNDPSTFLGPVIDEESRSRIASFLAKAQDELETVIITEPPQGGHFVPLAIFRDVPIDHPAWTEELFAPILCCRSVESFEEALLLATALPYALTGGVYSRSPYNIEKARKNFQVGNLYINRGCTGAIVERQPFGGFGHSGIGSKAGGPDYLLQFLEPRCISENTVRRGFTPEL